MSTAQEYEMDDFELSIEHKKILDKRLASHKSGKYKSFSWEEVKQRIKSEL